MDNFPKKYNPKKIKIDQNINKGGLELFSPCIPLDQNMNPGGIFSMYCKDMFCKLHGLYQENTQNKTTFTVSSVYHSSLETGNTKNIHTQTRKKISKNISFLKNLGLYVDEAPNNFTMTENFNHFLRNVFSVLYNKKRLKNEQNLIYWSKKYQTGVSDTNIETKEVEVPFYGIKYFIEAKGLTINVVTSRLETIFADVAIAVNPMDKRYKKLIGQNVIIPIINKVIPIIGEETVNMFDGEGAIRITPGHDEFGLNIAKKHGLPTDVFAIDTDGKFTDIAGEFAGKDVSEFYDNIVKYVDDIGNMNFQRTTKETRFFNKSTGEETFPISMNQWVLPYGYSKDFLLDFTKENGIFKDRFGENENIVSQIENKAQYNISKKSKRGILLPIISNEEKNILFTIDDDSLLEIYRQKKTRKDIVMTLVIINLILDNCLSPVFTLEELVDALFAANYFGNNTKLGEYINIYTELSQTNSDYKDGLKSLKKLVEVLEKDNEKIDYLLEILDDSFGIQMENGNISINFHDFFGEAGLTFNDNDCFNKGFIDSCQILYALGCEYSEKPYTEITAEDRQFVLSNDDCSDFLDILLLSLEYSKRLPFSDIAYHPILVDDKGQKINNYNSKFFSKDFYENLNLYGPSVLRLTTLLGDNFDEDGDFIIFNTYKANEYKNLLEKIWNANRYIFSKYREKYGPNKVKIIDILSGIDLENVSDYDARILQDLKIIFDEFAYKNAENKQIYLGKKLIQNYSSFFCDKYINITKILKHKDTTDVLILAGLLFLRLLYPYIPNFVLEIEEKFNVDRQGVDLFNLNIFDIKEKNYKINIFLDLIDKINNLKQDLGIKKHEFVDIFVQANPDFLQFLQSNESVFRLLTKIQDVNLIRIHEEIPVGYTTDNVINITLGIKKPEVVKVEIRKDLLVELENELKNKQEHLQHLKSLFASIYGDAGVDLVQKKREEISNLQNDIEDLEFRIGKLKIKNE